MQCGWLSEKRECSDHAYNPVKENLSLSYLGAIASYLGAQLEKQGRSMDGAGYDATITLPPNHIDRFTPWRVDCQLKCTSAPKFDASGTFLSYSIDKRIYESMLRTRVAPFILFVLVLPEDIDSWLSITTDKLIMTKAMYWFDARDNPRKIDSDQDTVTVRIPLKNVVNIESLSDLIRKGCDEDVQN